MNKEMMEIMVQDWIADHIDTTEAGDLILDGNPMQDQHKRWIQYCYDNDNRYLLVAINGNIHIEYLSTN